MRRSGIRWSVALGAALVSLVAFTAVANAAVGNIFERPVPTSGKGGLNRITHGPDGNIWFTNPGANEIGRMTPAGRFTGFPIPTPDSSPIDITTGPDGALWFTEFAGKIGRITTSGRITEFPIPGAAPGFGITSGPGGALWFVTSCCDATKPGEIGRITTSGAVTLFPVGAGTTPTVGITTGPDGNLWYPVQTGSTAAGSATSTADDRIQRMSPAGVVTGDFPIPTPYSDPSRIVTGPDGNLWFTEQGAVGSMGCCQPTFPSLGKIGRITPSGRITEFTTPGQSSLAAGSNPAGIAVGPDGNLWFTEYSYFTKDTMVQHGGNKIGRITPSGNITEFPIPTPYSRDDGITSGAPGDGHMYFTESPANFVYGAIGSVEASANPLGLFLLAGNRLTVRQGHVAIRFTCASPLACTGKFSLTTRLKLKISQKFATVVCASSRYSIKAHRTGTVNAKVRSSCIAALRVTRHHRVTAKVTSYPRTGQHALIRKVSFGL